MTTIHKATLQLTDMQDIKLPADAEILCVAVQGTHVCLWYRFEPTRYTDIRRIAMCGTGHPAPSASEGKYLGTVLLHGGTLVLHAFERITTA